MLRWLTAGESHGPALVAILEGLPAHVEVTSADIADALARRRLGYGRGARMKFEADEVRVVGGVRHGRTQGGPVAIEVGNTEWPKWEKVMSADPVDPVSVISTECPLPEVHSCFSTAPLLWKAPSGGLFFLLHTPPITTGRRTASSAIGLRQMIPPAWRVTGSGGCWRRATGRSGSRLPARMAPCTCTATAAPGRSLEARSPAAWDAGR